MASPRESAPTREPIGEPAEEAGDFAPVVVHDPAEFVEAAGRLPRRLLVLRGERPVSPAELRRYCLALGGVLAFEAAAEIRTVRNDPTIPHSTAMSLAALPMHTDGTFLPRPPDRFMLSFVEVDEGGGGVSTLMPLARVLAEAPDPVIEALLTADFLFPRGYDDLSDAFVGPVLYRERDGLRIRWRSDDLWRPRVMADRGTDAAGAVDWLHAFLAETPPLTYAARPGETLLIPNTLMLHGRTALTPGSPRELLRVWVDGR
ncbi:hypothetical protein FH609_028975 [Streptomyces sp. 3MP-14]|uniref:TauD/TfdA-like domain-containing protein n=1 Tax=Streptomyces mimosae TaxID=2586635 RepID=A0A5N5ZSE9_9ACTN|nr:MULTISPECIES: TauD/TfdA family dioxygenase [Streptomyces]KAB8158822.1 hypothetical protein FH607_028950 [Streptomyces mimosae]KAB8172724.1 hypothetical protein FH609_028975 [Streptomyces sp. 3MP-14]